MPTAWEKPVLERVGSVVERTQEDWCVYLPACKCYCWGSCTCDSSGMTHCTDGECSKDPAKIPDICFTK